MLKDSQLSKQESGKPSLIIINGLARSGTSWLGKLFDSHPQTLYRHEPDSLENPKWLPLVINKDYDQYRAILRDFVRHMADIRVPKVSASVPTFSKKYVRLDQEIVIRVLLSIVKGLSHYKAKVNIPRYCLQRANNDYVLVWKTIESSGRLSFYEKTLYNKRIIHIHRHPCGIIASQLRGQKANKFIGCPTEENYEVFQMFIESTECNRDGMTMKQIYKMSAVERLAWLYIKSMEEASRQLEGSADSKIIVYEDLCERPLEILRDLFDFCGLDFNKQSYNFLKKSVSKKEEGYYSIRKDPIESAYKWKRELSEMDQKLILKKLELSSISQLWSSWYKHKIG